MTFATKNFRRAVKAPLTGLIMLGASALPSFTQAAEAANDDAAKPAVPAPQSQVEGAANQAGAPALERKGGAGFIYIDSGAENGTTYRMADAHSVKNQSVGVSIIVAPQYADLGKAIGQKISDYFEQEHAPHQVFFQVDPNAEQMGFGYHIDGRPAGPYNAKRAMVEAPNVANTFYALILISNNENQLNPDEFVIGQN